MDLQQADKMTQLREVIERAISRVNTCIPGIVDSFDAATQTATVLPAIQMKVNLDGETTFLNLPPIVGVPLVFPMASTAGFALTLPVRKGDPCLLLFSQRAIDHWHEHGGIQPPEDGVGCRHHDLTDALAILAPVPLNEVLGSWEANGIELRNRAKTTKATVFDSKVELQSGSAVLKVSSDGTIEATAPAGAKITAPLTEVVGNLTVTGLTTTGGFVSQGVVGGAASFSGGIQNTGGSVSSNGKVLDSHTHSGVQPGGGNTGAPN